ncbi:MAG: metallophosphoesterase [Candidatus Bathyarchaeia archaeon]
MIIVVSDIHLGYRNSNRKLFLNFLEDLCKPMDSDDHLVLLGDILDFWRRNNVLVAIENEPIFKNLESLNSKIHYVVGNHDYTLMTLKLPEDQYFNVSKTLRIRDGGVSYNFIHGYQLEVLALLEPLTIEEYESLCISLCQRTGDFIGDILSVLWDTLHLTFKRGDRRRRAISSITEVPESRRDMHRVEQLARSSVKDLFLGLERGAKLIFGHTHRPFIEENVANTGSWVSDASVHNTYLTIDNGKMELKVYKP